MSAPVIDPESGVLYYPQYTAWEHQFSAFSDTVPVYDWVIFAGGFPTGMTFQPSLAATGASTGNLMTSAGHGLANGTALVFRSITSGGSPTPTTAVIYYVINKTTDTFQLSTTPGGTVQSLGADMSAALLYRPGFLTGSGTVPGVSTVQLKASNGTLSAAQLFTIGISSAAPAVDTTATLVWDFGANAIIAQSTSTLTLTPAPRDTPILFVKQQDDLIIRLRTTNGSTILDLGAVDDNACVLTLKENEGDGKIIISDASVKVSTGDANSILIHAKITGAAIKAAFSDFENDNGTFFAALAEIQITYPNPGYFLDTPPSLVRTSPTFRIQAERDLTQD